MARRMAHQESHMDMQVKKPWLAHYPASVPASIDATAYASLTDLLDEAFRKHAGRTALNKHQINSFRQ